MTWSSSIIYTDKSCVYVKRSINLNVLQNLINKLCNLLGKPNYYNNEVIDVYQVLSITNEKGK